MTENKKLTQMEVQALSFAASGMIARDIAAYLHISEKTVVVHLANGREKLVARNTTNAVAIAIRRGIIAGLSLVIAISSVLADNVAMRTNTRTSTRISRVRRRKA